MSKAIASAVRQFQLLPEDWRPFAIQSVTEFRGTSIDDTTKERTRLVDVVVQDVETGILIHKNYSIDKPSYLAQVLEAILPGESQNLLDSIDWATDDVDPIMGIEFEMKVYHEEFPVGSGTYQNKVGAARPLGAGELPRPQSREAEMEDATRSTITAEQFSDAPAEQSAI